MELNAPAGLSRKEAEVYAQLDTTLLPRHIAIIMDGNGRWARQRNLPRAAGHRAGVTSVRATIETAARIGIHSLTLYALSEENYKRRPPSEIEGLMKLLCRYLRKELARLSRNNIRVGYIGRIHEMPSNIQKEMSWARDRTQYNTGMILTLALNYSARSELIDAFRSLAGASLQSTGLLPSSIDEEAISQHLYTRHLPDPDLVIRTSGEMRLSNFLLWQIAYAEIHVTPVFWPDFRGIDLLDAIRTYQRRERRYGGIGEQVSSDELRRATASEAIKICA